MEILKDTIAGGAGGACLVLVGHPLDLIKVRFQTMQGNEYSGVIDCATKIIRTEGIRGLYRGMMAPLLTCTPMYSFCFFGYSVGKAIFTTPENYQNLGPMDLVKIGLAGATSGLFTTPILAPMERVKCILQIQNMHPPKEGELRFKGSKDLFFHLLKTGGVRSLARGYCATNLRDSLASVAYFSVYEYLKRKFTPKGQKRPNTIGTLMAGGFAGMANWVPAIPIDTLKSRLQTAPEGKYPKGIRSVAAEVFQKQGGVAKGMVSLYAGTKPVMIRAFPANAACFWGYETAKSFLN
jgi:solute carrier family 25 carnitine/acylcarnitine transporter 20/29